MSERGEAMMVAGVVGSLFAAMATVSGSLAAAAAILLVSGALVVGGWFV